MGIVVQASREILHRNPFPANDPRHREAGDEALEALLRGTDAEGFAGDRLLLSLARATFDAAEGVGATSVAEAYRLRSADRVEVVFLCGTPNPRALVGLPGRFELGFAHAIEVTRRDELAFRTSPCWRRAGGRGWLLLDPGEAPALARSAGREALEAAQVEAISRGLALDETARREVAQFGNRRVDVRLALRATSLPRSVRERAAASLAAVGSVADVVVALADVAGAADREEGETYARAAGRLLLRAGVLADVAAPAPHA